jgi:enamine deaminase RidA (YjgF/YER057c/UK114 family)
MQRKIPDCHDPAIVVLYIFSACQIHSFSVKETSSLRNGSSLSHRVTSSDITITISPMKKIEPARSTVQVSGLPRSALMEIEAIVIRG